MSSYAGFGMAAFLGWVVPLSWATRTSVARVGLCGCTTFRPGRGHRNQGHGAPAEARRSATAGLLLPEPRPERRAKQLVVVVDEEHSDHSQTPLRWWWTRPVT
jgi:hypothetical protein